MKKILVVIGGLCVSAAQAHPGHGHENPLSPGHYTGNPEHALPLALTIAVSAVLMVWGMSRLGRYLSKVRTRK
jgi:hypothetical protein